MEYPNILGTSSLEYTVLPPLALNQPLPESLKTPGLPAQNSKSIFAFWHSGINELPPYLLRNVIAWHRRFSPLGWTIYVLDTVQGSPLNVSRFIDTTSPTVVPAAFTNGILGGEYIAQHTSDLVRFPLLLKYGGVYLDVGVLQFGDLDWLWTEHITNPDSPYDFAGFTMGDASLLPNLTIVNFVLICGRNNPLIRRAHRILLELWQGKTTTAGMHAHPLVAHLSLMAVPREVALDDGGSETIFVDDQALTDYAIQIQCLGSAQRWLEEEDHWNGPKYVREKCWLLSMMDGAFSYQQMTGWSGQQQLELLNLPLPHAGEEETDEQAFARGIVEKLVGDSWVLKLNHGSGAKLFGGDTLGMLWKKYEGSDCGDGTYAGWLRWAEVSCKSDVPPSPMVIPVYEPTMKGKL